MRQHARGPSGGARPARATAYHSAHGPALPPSARFALAALSGALYFASQPPLAIAPLGFVALAPLLVAVSGTRPAAAAGLGWLAGTIACTALVAGAVQGAAVGYFALPAPLAIASGLFAAQLYGALWFAVFGLAAREIGERRPPGAFAAVAWAAAWVACDFGRSTVGDGVPWVLLAHSQASAPVFLQLADVAGASGPSFVLALASAAIAQALAIRSRRGAIARGAAVAAIAVAGALVYGRVRMAQWESPPGDPVRVGLVQGAVPDAWRYSLRFVPQVLDRLTGLTRSIAGSAPDLVVWPENAVSISVEANASAFASVAAVLPADARLLVGAPRAVDIAPGRAELRNSALLLDARGRVVAAADKLRLLPWAETAPWPARLTRLLRPRRSSDYSPGSAVSILEAGGAPFAVLVCSEDLYAASAREAVRRGASFLVAIGNDGWFGSDAARAQHFAAATLRAVETRRTLARATADGITAIVDPRGVAVAPAPAGEPAAVFQPILPISYWTAYVRMGDLFAWACVILAIAAAVLPPRGARSGEAAGEGATLQESR